jgi:hypothetical protein
MPIMPLFGSVFYTPGQLGRQQVNAPAGTPGIAVHSGLDTAGERVYFHGNVSKR